MSRVNGVSEQFRRHMDSGQPMVIGEVAQAHDGSLGTAHAFIDAIAEAGAHAVKFQTHIAAAESTPGEPWRIRFSPQDETRYDYWKRMEFSESQWRGLRDHAVERGLYFLSTPFSSEAVQMLESLDVAAWKVSSGEIANPPLVAEMAATGRPVILSTGMSPWDEIDRAVAAVRDAGSPVAVLQCTTAYPTGPAEIGLNVLAELRERYRCPVGLSDHSATTFAGLAAVALGASIVEVHVTLSPYMFGPDVVASLTIDQLSQLVQGAEFIHTALGAPIDKDAEAAARSDLRGLFTRSLVARQAMPAGHVLTAEDLIAKKPGVGISPDRLSEVVGLTLPAPLRADELLALELLDGGEK